MSHLMIELVKTVYKMHQPGTWEDEGSLELSVVDLVLDSEAATWLVS